MSYFSNSFLDIRHKLTIMLKLNDLIDVVISKLIWARRNDTVHQEVFSHPYAIIDMAKNVLQLVSSTNSSKQVTKEPISFLYLCFMGKKFLFKSFKIYLGCSLWPTNGEARFTSHHQGLSRHGVWYSLS